MLRRENGNPKMEKGVKKFSDLIIMFQSGTVNAGFSADEQSCPKRIRSDQISRSVVSDSL